ncbi:MAG: ribosome hibernation-promoting factor, HPF/YfiA family [Actinomycetota bacterium]
MQVIVRSRHTSTPDHLKDLATRKLEKLERILDRILKVEVEFSEEHNPRIADKHSVEVTLKTKAHTLRAQATGGDPTAAVEGAVKKIEAQVKKLKEKRVERWKGGSATRRGKALTPPEAPTSARNGSERPIESQEVPEQGEADGPRISRRKRFDVKPMTAEEAVLQMESLGHDFYLYLDAESEQAGVVYRRRDGSFGLIEPV